MPGRIAVAVVAADALIAARAERLGSLAGEHDDPDRRVVAGNLERARELEERRRPERIAHLGTVDGQLRDAAGGLVANVLPLAGRDPLHDGMHLTLNSNRSLSMVARQGRGGRAGYARRMAGSDFRRALRAGDRRRRRAQAGPGLAVLCSGAHATLGARVPPDRRPPLGTAERAALLARGAADAHRSTRRVSTASRASRSTPTIALRRRHLRHVRPVAPRRASRSRGGGGGAAPRRQPSTLVPRTDGSRACPSRTSAGCSCSSATCCSAPRSRSAAASRARPSHAAPRRALHLAGADAAHPPARRRRRSRPLPGDPGGRIGHGSSTWAPSRGSRGARRADLRDDRDLRRSRLRGAAAFGSRGARVARWGELLVRGPTLMRGYRLDPEATTVAAFEPGRLAAHRRRRRGCAGRNRARSRAACGRDRQRWREDLAGRGGGRAREPPRRRGRCSCLGSADREWGERVVARVVPRRRS